MAQLRKKIFIFVLLVFCFWWLNLTNISYWAAKVPKVICVWLPWCDKWKDWNLTELKTNKAEVIAPLQKLISEAIKYVSILAVLALMWSGIMYLVSIWEEEKTKKAKTWIMWSLISVILSVSAFSIISLINKLTIGS